MSAIPSHPQFPSIYRSPPRRQLPDDARASYLEATRERLMDGDLALDLNESDARELLQELMGMLYPGRILDSREDYQDVIVAARELAEKYADRLAEGLADDYLETACRG